MQIGANQKEPGNWDFCVWAPFQTSITLVLADPLTRKIPLQQGEKGYWNGSIKIPDNTRYFFELDNGLIRSDPASKYQPEGIYGPSEILSFPVYLWTDNEWAGINIQDMIIYELHTGTFTREGTFSAIIPRLERLIELGITAIEVMPIAQFPGERNWGYDGVFPFSVQNSYGGPENFASFVNACHLAGIAVILDVVYNHLGPEGCFLREFGPYYSNKYHTPWGNAFNFDDEYSDEVRNFFFENARMWLEDYHIDALRLDAIHAICDMSSKPFLAELTEVVCEISQRTKQKKWLIAESDQNDTKVLRSIKEGGYGIHAQGCEDFHHSLHTLLTGEKSRFYVDYGSISDLTQSLQEGFVYNWKYSAFRKRHHGSSSKKISPDHFIVFSQNHDQIGNRIQADRISTLVSFEALKLAAGIVILSPYIPFLFMGEEYGEITPFYYFISHLDPDLVEAVRIGRKKDQITNDPNGIFIDPQDKLTFQNSCIKWDIQKTGKNAKLFSWYQALINLRKTNATFQSLSKDGYLVTGDEMNRVITVKRTNPQGNCLCIMNFSKNPQIFQDFEYNNLYRKILDSADSQWGGPNNNTGDVPLVCKPLITSPESISVYEIIK